MTDGLLDTSVVIDLDDLRVVEQLPNVCSVSAVTLAELAVGIATATDRVVAARRQFRLQQVESRMDALPFTDRTARHYAYFASVLHTSGIAVRPRAFDLMIAATAAEHHLTLVTRDLGFRQLERELDVQYVEVAKTT
jgi:predicted nucleic acid-binding protein